MPSVSRPWPPAGAADDPRPDKSAWIRLWAAARQARGKLADADAWSVALSAVARVVEEQARFRVAEHTPYTPAQLALRRMMEQISEEHWASGWYNGLERILWRSITEPGAGAMLTAEERDVLRWLMTEAGGWWRWPKGAAEPQFVSLREWQRLYQDGGPLGTA